MKKHFFPHLEVGSFLETERLMRMHEEAGYGINDFCRAAHLNYRTYKK